MPRGKVFFSWGKRQPLLGGFGLEAGFLLAAVVQIDALDAAGGYGALDDVGSALPGLAGGEIGAVDGALVEVGVGVAVRLGLDEGEGGLAVLGDADLHGQGVGVAVVVNVLAHVGVVAALESRDDFLQDLGEGGVGVADGFLDGFALGGDVLEGRGGSLQLAAEGGVLDEAVVVFGALEAAVSDGALDGVGGQVDAAVDFLGGEGAVLHGAFVEISVAVAVGFRLEDGEAGRAGLLVDVVDGQGEGLDLAVIVDVLAFVDFLGFADSLDLGLGLMRLDGGLGLLDLGRGRGGGSLRRLRGLRGLGTARAGTFAGPYSGQGVFVLVHDGGPEAVFSEFARQSGLAVGVLGDEAAEADGALEGIGLGIGFRGHDLEGLGVVFIGAADDGDDAGGFLSSVFGESALEGLNVVSEGIADADQG